MPNALVTGGAGFIGSHIVEELLRRGHHVRVLDNFSTGKRENLVNIQQKIELIEGDLTDGNVVSQAVRGMDYVFHLGAIPSVVRSVENPFQSHQANVLGTLNVLLACRENKIKRLVYSSSSSLYGDQPILPKEESMKPDPLSPYAGTKLAGEQYCSIFYATYGIPTVSLRYFNVFGPKQDPTSLYSAVIPRFIDCSLDGKPPTIYGDGKQTRDFTYIEDVVEANLRASEAPPKALGRAYNIAGGKSVSLLELLSEIQAIIGCTVAPVFEPPRPGDVRDSLAAIERAKKDLNFQPRFTLAEGLKKTVEWFAAKKNGHYGSKQDDKISSIASRGGS